MSSNTNAVGSPIVGNVHVSEGDDDMQTREGRIAIPLQGEDALRGLLQVDPQSEAVEESKS
jgi:hypothetical protein